MSTPNSPTRHVFDIHTEPGFANQFVAGSERQTAVSPMLGSNAVKEHARCNVGRTEQKLRLVAGAALVTAAAVAPVSRGWRLAFALFGGMELVTGATRFCPLWKALGINTCEQDR